MPCTSLLIQSGEKVDEYFYLRYYLSNDTVLDATDAVVYTRYISPGLAAGGEVNVTQSILLPTGISGDYYITVHADYAGQVPDESVTANNVLASSVIYVGP